MTKPFEFHGLEAEKEEAMRRYNNRRNFRNILRASAIALLSYSWFPTAVISLQTAGNWIQVTGSVIVTNRSVVFFFTNLIIVLILSLSRDSNNHISNTEPDLYEQYTSSSAVTVTAAEKSEVKLEDDDLKKQIVPVFIAETGKEVDQESVKTNDVKVAFRRTKSERKKKVSRQMTEFRRTESAKVVAIERLSSEEFRLKVERFIMEKKRTLIQENDIVFAAVASGYGTC